MTDSVRAGGRRRPAAGPASLREASSLLADERDFDPAVELTPVALLLLAVGMVSPWPATMKLVLLDSIAISAALTESARRSESSWLAESLPTESVWPSIRTGTSALAPR